MNSILYINAVAYVFIIKGLDFLDFSPKTRIKQKV